MRNPERLYAKGTNNKNILPETISETVRRQDQRTGVMTMVGVAQ